MEEIKLEAPVFTVEAALKAVEYGIDRLEFCSDFSEGGTTPSPGAFSFLKSRLPVPIFVMIRPRGTDFVYSDEEVEVMEREISIFKTLNADGFVFGALSPDGSVDKEVCQRLIKAAKGKPCTFHRAFDVSKNWNQSLEDIIELGFERILTSGAKNSVSEGMANLKEIIKAAANRIIIMPGGGLKPDHLNDLLATGQLKEVHASCKGWRESEALFQNPELQLSSSSSGNRILTVDPEVVKSFMRVLGQYSYK
jgi:copper homeostasis protein